jgi:hypothetical protein
MRRPPCKDLGGFLQGRVGHRGPGAGGNLNPGAGGGAITDVPQVVITFQVCPDGAMVCLRLGGN